LSINYNGETRALCDTGFTDEDAAIACTELYGSPEFKQYSHGHHCDYEDFWLDGIACKGTEKTIQECTHSNWGTLSAKSTQCVANNSCIRIYCTGGGPQLVEYTLEHDETTGALGITYNGETRAICDSSFNSASAEIVCSELYG
jgi:hypothetical protein